MLLQQHLSPPLRPLLRKSEGRLGLFSARARLPVQRGLIPGVVQRALGFWLWLLQAVFAKRPGRAAAPRRAGAVHLLPTEPSKGCPEPWLPSLVSLPGFYPGTEGK